MTPAPAEIAARVESLHHQIRERTDRDVTLVAVTKGFGLDVVHAARAAGLVDLGENYAQELVEKAAALGTTASSDTQSEGDIRWHFIGGLQRNKVRTLAGIVHLWHSLDRARLIDEVARRDPGASVLVQVNVSGAGTQAGCDPADTAQLVARGQAAGLDVRGLMTIGRLGDADAARPGFALLRQLADDLGLPDCSMGMSADVLAAVDEGATIVRVGTTLFGPRPPRVSLPTR